MAMAAGAGRGGAMPPQEPGRVVLGRMERQKVDRLLAEYLKNVKANYVLLVDKEGVLITRQGEIGQVDVDTISALVAGAYAVSEQMAQALGRDAYKTIVQESEKDNVHLSQVGTRTVLAVFFDAGATLGMVRHYAKPLTQQLETILASQSFRPPGMR